MNCADAVSSTGLVLDVAGVDLVFCMGWQRTSASDDATQRIVSENASNLGAGAAEFEWAPVMDSGPDSTEAVRPDVPFQ